MNDHESAPQPPATEVPAGTLRGLMTLADDSGRFSMIAVDQRPPIFAALARHGNRRPDDVSYDEVAAVKGVLVQALAPSASALLLDPVWSHPHHLTSAPGRVGLISTLEDYTFDLVAGERRSRAIEDWSVAKIKRSGAQAVKLLAWYRPDASDATLAHQQAFVEAAARACREHELPFVLELLTYPLGDERADDAAYALAKPRLVIESVKTFAEPRFGVDLFKLEFPADLKYTGEFASGAFDGRSRTAVYSLDDVRGFLHEVDAATSAPWVLLSAGVGPHEFSFNLELACLAGASGFLAGRAVWYDALEGYPDLETVQARLRAASRPYLRGLCALAERGRPWFEHPRFAGGVRVAGAGQHWFRTYGA